LDNIRTALGLYERGNYQEALPIFKQILTKSQTNHAVNLYAGISFMEIRKYNEATASFEQIIEHKNNLYIEQAEWYAGLCYLVSDQEEKAQRQFTKIVNRDGYYRDQAREILKKMK
jgi:tetratricopeptide (TPR) repeat protein